jgi:DNA uptake protein ComE-like DNA-binding protein
MTRIANLTLRAIVTSLAPFMMLLTPAAAQVGAGLIDPNTANESQLAQLPHMTPAIAKDVLSSFQDRSRSQQAPAR